MHVAHRIVVTIRHVIIMSCEHKDASHSQKQLNTVSNNVEILQKFSRQLVQLVGITVLELT